MSRTLWQPRQILERLADEPDQLEPGLLLFCQPLALGHDRFVPLHGTDPLEHPCLVFFEERFEPGFFESLLDAIGRMEQAEVDLAAPYAHRGRARVFVLTPGLEASVLQRMEVLSRAVPLRAFSVGLSRVGDELVPVLSQEFPHHRGESDAMLDDLPPESARPARRVLQAARCVRPAVELRGPDSPWIFIGRTGPLAALHRQDDALLFAAGREVLPLTDDAAADAAIDLLLRGQWQEPQAEPEAEPEAIPA